MDLSTVFVVFLVTYPPGTIVDLRLVAVDSTRRRVTLKWTAPGAHMDMGTGNGASASAMMTSSNGNIFAVTGPLCGEFIGHR